MKHNGAIALVVTAVLGLTVAFLGGSLTPSGSIANEVTESTGDAFLCGTSTSVSDSFVDIDKVNIRQVKGGWEVTVSMGPSMETIFTDSFSAAVEVRLGIYTGLYQIHNNNLTINNATLTTEFLIFFFAVLLPLEVDLKVDSFHQAEDGDPINCDTAFLEDATAGKVTPTASPTATVDATTTPPTPTGTAESVTATPTPSTTATTTPSPSTTPPTATTTPMDTPTDTPEPGTATPTPTVTPELKQMRFFKTDADRGNLAMSGWEMKIFDGDGCIGSPRASGFTVEGPDDFSPRYTVKLPPGEYSVAETQQPGWERIFPEGNFCQNFSVPWTDLCCTFANKRIRDGDVNKDGVTNSIDVVLVLQFIAGLIPRQPNTVRADVNEDSMVNSVDTALMLQFEAGLIDSLPVLPGGG